MSNSNEMTSGVSTAPNTCTYGSYDAAPDSGAAVGVFGATSLSTEDYGSSHFSSLHDSLEHRPSLFSDAFQTRWRQAWSTMQAYRWCEEPDDESLAQVRTHLGLLIKLLSEESNQDADLYSIALSSPKLSPLAQFLIYEEMLTKLNNWLKTVGVADIPLFFQVLQIYQFVLEQVTPANCRLVLQQSRFSASLIELLEIVPEYLSIVYSGSQKFYKTMFEECLMQLLHIISNVLAHDPHLHRSLLLMEDDSSSGGSFSQVDIKFCGDKLARGTRWPLFELLVRFLHRPNLVGERARESMLICLSCTRRFDYLGSWVVDETDFCPLLATGLSGLFSELPRTLLSEKMSFEHFRVYHEMLESTSELQLFLRCLHFCDEALGRSHPFIQVEFHDFFFNGFLRPVLGPALHQSVTAVPICDLESLPQFANTVDEIITTTAYFDLFLRTIAEPFLVKLFIEFVLNDHYDNGVSMLDIFLTRFTGKSKISIVTIILLNTLLQTNCDDLHRALVTKFLGNDDDDGDDDDFNDSFNDDDGGVGDDDDDAIQKNDCLNDQNKQTKKCVRSPIAMFKVETAGVHTALMMNYRRHWMSFSALKLLKSSLVNYLQTTRNSRHEQFSFYLNYLFHARESFLHLHHITSTPTTGWIMDLLKNHERPIKITHQILAQVFASKSHEKIEFLAFIPFLVKNCHYDEESKQICMILENQNNEHKFRNAERNRLKDSPAVGVFLDTLCKLIRSFFQNDVCTNLHVTELLTTLLQTPDRRLFRLLFDETLVRPIGIPCLLHILQILSVEGQRYADSIPNFDSIFASVKRALFPDNKLGNCNPNNNSNINSNNRSSSASNNNNDNSNINQSSNSDGRKRFTLRSLLNRLSTNNNSNNSSNSSNNNNNNNTGSNNFGMINGFTANLVGRGQQQQQTSLNGTIESNRRLSNASIASLASSLQVQVNESSTSVRYFNQNGSQILSSNIIENKYSHIIHNLIIFDHFLLELSAILLEISVVMPPEDC